MKIIPRIVLADLEKYLDLFDFRLSEETRKILSEVEEFAYQCDNPPNHNLFLSKTMRNSKIIRDVVKESNKNPDLIALKLEKDYYNCIDKIAKYNEDYYSYSEIDNRQRNEKTAIIDIALEYCAKDNRNILKNEDIFLAAIDDYERILHEDDSQWVDKRLNKADITFSHVCGYYDDTLEIKFEEIRKTLFNIKEDNRIIKVA